MEMLNLTHLFLKLFLCQQKSSEPEDSLLTVITIRPPNIVWVISCLQQLAWKQNPTSLLTFCL